MKKFIRYSTERDVVFVFGAGTSQPDGVPLQDELLPLIMEPDNKNIRSSSIGQSVIKFISDNFYFKPEKGLFPKIEAVFGFLDYFIIQKESLSSNYSLEILIQIKEYLIKLIHYIVDENTNRDSVYYHRFWETVAGFNKNISVITLDYDTLLEQAFEFIFRRIGYIDYCIPLMNYEQRKELLRFNFWVNAREPVEITSEENDPALFKIIKLHGSLNWKYCNCCNQTLLTPWDRKIDLNRDKFIGYTYPEMEEYEYVCPIDKTDFQTLILPPSYVKTLTQPVIAQLLVEASREIRSTKKIVFAGYSFSNADIHIKALFQKHLNPETKLYVINPKNSGKLKMKYRALTENVSFINMSFEDMVSDEGFMKKLLTESTK